MAFENSQHALLNSKDYFVPKNGFKYWLKISYIHIQIRLRFGIANSINKYLGPKVTPYKTQISNLK